MEMQMNGGSWEASMADRFPEVLDDASKKVHELFFLSAQSWNQKAFMLDSQCDCQWPTCMKKVAIRRMELP
eukprot:12938532-Prorocentrum_lima.AAC.1